MQTRRIRLQLRSLIHKHTRRVAKMAARWAIMNYLMKTSKAVCSGVAMMALTLLSATPTTAHTARSRPMTGVIEYQNGKTRSVMFRPANGEAPTEYVLKNATKFIQDSHFVAATELRAGTKAVVYYRHPFFGKPFVTKIVWFNGQ